MSAKLLVCLAFVLISCSGILGRRRYDHLQAFEKFSPYPWTQWLRFHPSAAAFAALGDSHPTPPPVLIPPVDPVRFSTSEEEDDDDDDLVEEEDDDIGFGFFKRAALDNSFTKQLNFSFWAGKPIPFPAGADLLSKLDDLRYSAAQKSLFLARLFDALAKAVINSTGLVTNDKGQIATTPSGPKDDDDEDLVIPEIERSVSESEEPKNGDSSTTENSEESSTATTPSMLEKKLDFLKRLNAIITTTQPPPPSTKKPKLPKPEKSKSKANKTKKGKPTFQDTATTTTPEPTPSLEPVPFSYEDVAKMILDVDEQ